MWPLLVAAVAGSLESDFRALVEARHLHIEPTAAQLWQLYVPSLSITVVPTTNFTHDALAIADAHGWSTENKVHSSGVFVGEEAEHTCGQLHVESNGRWRDQKLLLSGAGDTLLDVDIRLVAGERHTTLCGKTECPVGHECVSSGALPKLCLSTRPPTVSDDSWLVIVLVLSAITVLVYHVWRQR